MNTVVAILILIGAGFIFIGGLGAYRMPDMMLRMHATTKAGALGGGLVAIAVGLYFADPAYLVRTIAILVFVVLTAPVAAHAIARAGYFTGVPFWEKTLKDELREKLDTKGHHIYSGLESNGDVETRRED
ncbi:monovalent cation/H(+) antiporter subunit G [Methylonatrum kenyense]|uniref:monovalent cation/H(+) antiporter subunit G n=1 Tax=Methylonatrum kenyense TaxID=455253 RepID=UPI0020BF1004|nr:monovalent cation/H(+) antiporter subunit G [Methylonatrum kenyense]MCK8517105.1 monovalent cation/H(+) antiporter subunit G [Methylonatrum kenyense]